MGLSQKLNGFAQKGNRKRYAHFEHGALAEANGLVVVKGDPSFSWMIDVPGRYSQVGSGTWSAMSDKNALDLLAAGTVHGRPAELVWSDGACKRIGVLTTKISYSYDGRASLVANSSVPPFEVTNREAQAYGAYSPAPVLEGSEEPFADPALQATYRCVGGDAGITEVITPAIQQLLPLEWAHVLWDGDQLSYVLQPYTVMLLDRLPQIFAALATGAAAIEQRWP
jgi:hypothetical protein